MAIRAMLFDRDGTLVQNVPHNADPAKVVVLPTVLDGLNLARAASIPMAVVSNQSVLGRGLATREQVDATNRRVEELLGPIGKFYICPHAPWQNCACRKPQPDLLLAAAADLGVDPSEIAFIGDMGSDLGAATAAGMLGILVPSVDTPAADVARSPQVASTLLAAVQLALAQ